VEEQANRAFRGVDLVLSTVADGVAADEGGLPDRTGSQGV